MKRRNFLKGAGALTILVAGGIVYRSYDQGLFSAGEEAAYEAWKTWKSDAKEGPLALVRAAILAANPHNTQPWLFKVTETSIELFADTKRHLGSFDPYRREMHLGLGCALENMVLAAAANAYKTTLSLSPGSLLQLGDTVEPGLVARIDLADGGVVNNPLYDAIPDRHTNRGPYDLERIVSTDVLRDLNKLSENDADVKAIFFSSEADRQKFGNALISATETIIADSVMIHDSERWMRHSWDDIKKYRDGISVDAAGLPPLMTAIAKIMPPLSEATNSKYWLQGTRDVHVATTPVFGLVAVRDLYDIAQTLQAGRVWQRMHLWATTQGIAMHPVNQMIEMVDRERQLNKPAKAEKVLADLTKWTDWTPTFGFRMGYALSEAKSSPRRPIDDVTI